MKVQKSAIKPEPQYPSRRQLPEYTALLGAAALGLGSLAGMAAPPATPAAPSENAPKEAGAPPIALGGVMVVEPPPPPRIAGGIRPEPPPGVTNIAVRATYVVQKGDTLSSIAKTRLGNSERACEIAKANPGLKPDELKPGQILVLPPPMPGGTNSVRQTEGVTPPPPPQVRGELRMPSEAKEPKP